MIEIPFAAASDQVSESLLALFILLLAAKIGEEICRRIHQPVVIGEILAGTIVGPSVLGLIHIDTVLSVFAELGVIFLLFWVGLETETFVRSAGRRPWSVFSASSSPSPRGSEARSHSGHQRRLPSSLVPRSRPQVSESPRRSSSSWTSRAARQVARSWAQR
jgi:hypothetical protein